MNDIRDLYQEVIIDHGRKPRNFGVDENANRIKEGYNPLCGDHLTVYLTVSDDGKIERVQFYGSGCAISMASASLMTESIKGKTLQEAHELFNQFHQLITKGEDRGSLGKLRVLAGVTEFPMRVKCATLAWHTLIGAVDNDSKPISTENR